MKNVLYLNYSMQIGGIERMILDFVRYIDRGSFHPHVAVMSGGGSLEKELHSCGVPVHDLTAREGIDFNVILRLRRILKEENIEILHTHNYSAWLYGTAANIGWRALQIHTEHSKVEDLLRRKWLERALSHVTDAVVAVSAQVRDHLVQDIRASSRRVRLIYNGIDTGRFQRVGALRSRTRKELGFEDGVTVFGIVARLEPVKDHDILLRAFARIFSSGMDARMVVVGDGSLRYDLMGKVRGNGLQGKVIFLGERSDIPELLNAMDVYVLSSHDEGLNLTLLEAMSAGLPVIATRAGGNPEVVIEGITGILVPLRDEDSLHAAMCRLLHDHEERRRMATEGERRVVESFSLKRMIEEYENLYRKGSGSG